MILYARKEPTTCRQTRAQPAPLSNAQRDVVLYADPEATHVVARYPWHYDKPTRRNRYVMHNCARYALHWLADMNKESTNAPS